MGLRSFGTVGSRASRPSTTFNDHPFAESPSRSFFFLVYSAKMYRVIRDRRA